MARVGVHACGHEGDQNNPGKDSRPLSFPTPDPFLFRPPAFTAVSEAFHALIALGERQAVPLAIERISPEPELYNTRLVEEIKTVTGTNHGFDKGRWKKWWRSVEADWTIPSQFLTHSPATTA